MRLLQNRWLGWAAVVGLFFGIQFAVNRHLPTGEPPSITGQTLVGQPFDLALLRGKPAVIYFWASWCPICRGMQSSVDAVAQDHPLISVAMQSGTRAELMKYMDAQAFHVPTVPDEDGSISGRYGLHGVPAVFVLGPEGRIRYATSGYTSEIGIRLRVWLAGL